MNYRRLGRTNLRVSVIGFGTCQLRLVPERIAVETLRRGFELGVNIVHTAPDYEGADDLVAKAVRESARDVIVCSQGYGSMDLFEYFFESTCTKFGKRSLELFGIACIEDREALGENVWGPGGMIEFLQRKKREGRLGGIFCTTHGSPEYIKTLVETNVFDALMVAYNILGFHLLSFSPFQHPTKDRLSRSWSPPQRTTFESISRHRAEVFPLARQYDIGLMIMKPLAGGLLCAGKAFPPRASLGSERPPISAREALRVILKSPEVSCVLPGTASPAEAEENALSGYGDIAGPDPDVQQLNARARSFDTAICSRCGLCDSSCSHDQPISWLFRAAYLSLYPSETFESRDEFDYFNLLPQVEAPCGVCTDVTCHCPYGIDIQSGLVQIHQAMSELTAAGLVPPPNPLRKNFLNDNGYGARIVIQDIPDSISAGTAATGRLYLENIGRTPWYAKQVIGKARTSLLVYSTHQLQQIVRLRFDVHPGERGHFVFELSGPTSSDHLLVSFDLVEVHPSGMVQQLHLLQTEIAVKHDQGNELQNETPACLKRGVRRP